MFLNTAADYKNLSLCVLAGACSAVGIYKLTNVLRRQVLVPNCYQLVVITGCDSGLGYNLATYCHSLGMSVIAACFDIKSEGAIRLMTNKDLNRMKVYPLDLRDDKSIFDFRMVVEEILAADDKYELAALVNNAAIMVFGECEWLTNAIIENQITTNLTGTIKFTNAFLPLMRKYRGRILNVSSHCGIQALPGLGPYSASKAGLRFWNDSLRIEMNQYGVDVVSFIPGSFVASSNIASRQMQYCDQMEQSFSEEQKLFYSEYFKRYLKYLGSFCKRRNVINMQAQDEALFNKFKKALLDVKPRHEYKHEPSGYAYFHFLFRIVPESRLDKTVLEFARMPRYHENK